MRAALASLANVSAQSNQCPPEVLSACSTEMQRLQVESMPLRVRAQAMQARGEAYFERWHEHLAQVKDPEVRALAEQNRPALEERFRKIKAITQDAREALGPFQANLRKVRNALESDPASIGASSTREWMATAKAEGERVERYLGEIVGQLDSMRGLITPAGGRSKH
jgi:hypothetical protein